VDSTLFIYNIQEKKMKSTFLKHTGLIGAMVLMAGFSTSSYGAQEAGDRDFTLSGSGASDSGFDTSVFGATASVGWFTTRDLEWGVRQTANIADTEATTSLNGATRAFLDYHLDYAMWQPFIGASLGVQYGSLVKDAFFIGPELGAKYYVMPKTYILGQVAYQFQVDQDIDEGSTFYNLGIGFNF
jgi:hypothetical protein